MKELSIEEKAKAYDEALKVLHKYDGANIMFTQDLKEEMFPELKESDDEKMMNQLYLWMKEFGGAEEYTEKVYQWIKGLLEKQKSAWSKEDEEKQKAIVGILDYQANISENRICATDGYIVDDLIYWLKSLKERVQSQQKWSEENEYVYNKILNWIVIVNPTSSIFEKLPKEQFIKRLKSFKSQSRWKPTDEQMIALRDVISGCSYDIEQLVELETKLKEL